MRSIGLDIHRDFCEVAIGEGAEIRSAGRIEMTPEALELFAHMKAAGVQPSSVTYGAVMVSLLHIIDWSIRPHGASPAQSPTSASRRTMG